MKRQTTFFLLLLLTLGLTQSQALLAITTANAMQRVLEEDAAGTVTVVWNATTATPSFIRGQFALAVTGKPQSATAQEAGYRWLAHYATILGITQPTTELQLVKTVNDPLGYQHLRFQQVYAGLPVYAAELQLHLTTDNHNLIALSNSFVPDVQLATTTPTFTQSEAVQLARRALPSSQLATEPSLAIYIAQRQVAPTPHLAWLLERWDATQAIHNVYVIDAHTGVILDVWSQIHDARDRRIHTADNTQDAPGRLVRKEGDGPTGDIDTDRAYDYAGDTYDYYFSTFGRDSFDGNGVPMVATVHFGENYLNAGYTPYLQQIVYGDGMVSKDVTGHEWSHGVINATANLTYRWQSGALNESFADIFGAMIDRDDWLIGEDLPAEVLQGYPGIRSMEDPSLMGQPGHTDDWSARCDDQEGVHVNSGITNKAYYNIAQAIGKEKAERIFYRALTVYLQASSSLEDARVATLQAAADLYGAGSAESTAVDTGMRAVGLDGVWNPPENDCDCAVTAVMATDGVATNQLEAINTIANLYRLRDELLATTATGERYRVLYEKHSGAATRLLFRSPALLADGGTILLAADAGIVGLLDGAEAASEPVVTATLIAQIQAFLEALAIADRAAPTGGALAAMLEQEVARIDWAKLEGKSYRAAWDELNNPAVHKVYLPFVQE